MHRHNHTQDKMRAREGEKNELKKSQEKRLFLICNIYTCRQMLMT